LRFLPAGLRRRLLLDDRRREWIDILQHHKKSDRTVPKKWAAIGGPFNVSIAAGWG
jgi:hypothetical protein